MSLSCSVAWFVEVFGGMVQPLTDQQNHNDDDEQEADRAAANPNGTTKNRQE
jgi:hypothetical protein